MYIWLNEKGKKQLKQREEDWGGGKKRKFDFLGDIRVETNEKSGKKYINIYESPTDPATDIPNISQDLIEKVTFKETIYRGFRTEGIYRHEGAVLMVKRETRVHSEVMANTVEREDWQEISVAAPTIEALRAIHTLVRQGKLQPEEDWERPAPAPELKEAAPKPA